MELNHRRVPTWRREIGSCLSLLWSYSLKAERDHKASSLRKDKTYLEVTTSDHTFGKFRQKKEFWVWGTREWEDEES